MKRTDYYVDEDTDEIIDVEIDDVIAATNKE